MVQRVSGYDDTYSDSLCDKRLKRWVLLCHGLELLNCNFLGAFRDAWWKRLRHVLLYDKHDYVRI
jgi:hypothetical protein